MVHGNNADELEIGAAIKESLLHESQKAQRSPTFAQVRPRQQANITRPHTLECLWPSSTTKDTPAHLAPR